MSELDYDSWNGSFGIGEDANVEECGTSEDDEVEKDMEIFYRVNHHSRSGDTVTLFLSKL